MFIMYVYKMVHYYSNITISFYIIVIIDGKKFISEKVE